MIASPEACRIDLLGNINKDLLGTKMLSVCHQVVSMAENMLELGPVVNKRAPAEEARAAVPSLGSYRVLPVGDAAYLVEFFNCSHLHARLLAFCDFIERSKLVGVSETVIGLKNVLVHCDPESDGSLQHELEQVAAAISTGDCREGDGKRWQIPVCYDADLALDLAEVSARCGMTPAQVARLHAGRTYRVSMTGFMPGQPYLSDLPGVLQLPRRLTPRMRVAAGSVAIATSMTVIYPSDCPAGWHIVGRTPATLFDVCADPPAFLSPGDRVRFVPVLRGDYDSLAAAVSRNEWHLAPEQGRSCCTD